MRTNVLAASTAVAATTLLALAPPPAGAEPAEQRERGVVLDCRGSAAGHEVYVAVYENDVYGNHLQVVLDDDRGASATPKNPVRGGVVDTALRLAGHRAHVTGDVVRVGRAKRVHEEHHDGGQHIVVDGTHRALRNDLALTYRGTEYPLTCADAFAFDVTTTRTPEN